MLCVVCCYLSRIQVSRSSCSPSWTDVQDVYFCGELDGCRPQEYWRNSLSNREGTHGSDCCMCAHLDWRVFFTYGSITVYGKETQCPRGESHHSFPAQIHPILLQCFGWCQTPRRAPASPEDHHEWYAGLLRRPHLEGLLVLQLHLRGGGGYWAWCHSGVLSIYTTLQEWSSDGVCSRHCTQQPQQVRLARFISPRMLVLFIIIHTLDIIYILI
jgi:hypothetical protein